jgi:hypothetical protein
MDVHKDSIDVAAGEERGGEVRHYGAIGGELAAVTRLARDRSVIGIPPGQASGHAAVRGMHLEP